MDPERFLDEAIPKVQAAVPAPSKAIVAASGGIDSTVAAVVVTKALGERATALFIDTGLLRRGEVAKTEEVLNGAGVPHRVVPAASDFFRVLKGVTDPEKKRKSIGETFIRVFEKEAVALHADYLVQGTIAPDWIESGSAAEGKGGPSARDTIKTHHNVGGLPPDMKLKVVEPLRDLYKDEVRTLARHLKVPAPERQPFPGPGLAVRVVGEVTPERTEIARVACAVVEEEVERAAHDGKMPLPWQYFATLLPVRTVGVIGDVRTHADAVSVRAVESIDAMTATAVAIPHDVLRRISERITRELSGKVSRVLYDITDKPPATIEWE
ncbi:MAG: glutamine-hydrolyzing GMP synthase subunit GuaA [Euryarchaeota archaeon]|nr:glutamine-hydrolyzing GMP synthase subunit GuaA [Euryarchaeota archaeon]MDE1837719.1 glutamine-hydrolyzing GMP synthase subunit GuaA [Euryarchaeota archaeon]MDE1881958.1 glutamine-hydrolyzing GMP synthase subunit GuaA [Euryarchaeota archaeon]MDE2046118.1 glutamine-hydrolyzing GMP synthase subunit GuaA [Thermoplasmata archaeon]